MIPISIYVKGGIAALLLSVGFWSGCQVQAKRDQGVLKSMTADRDAKAAELAIAGGVLRQVDAQTVQTKADADRQAERAKGLVKQARQALVVYRNKVVAIDLSIDTAMLAPACRAQLEQRLCVPLD